MPSRCCLFAGWPACDTPCRTAIEFNDLLPWWCHSCQQCVPGLQVQSLNKALSAYASAQCKTTTNNVQAAGSTTPCTGNPCSNMGKPYYYCASNPSTGNQRCSASVFTLASCPLGSQVSETHKSVCRWCTVLMSSCSPAAVIQNWRFVSCNVHLSAFPLVQLTCGKFFLVLAVHQEGLPQEPFNAVVCLPVHRTPRGRISTTPAPGFQPLFAFNQVSADCSVDPLCSSRHLLAHVWGWNLDSSRTGYECVWTYDRKGKVSFRWGGAPVVAGPLVRQPNRLLPALLINHALCAFLDPWRSVS